MSSVIFDPEDPSRAIIASASVGVFGVQRDTVIENVHPDDLCHGRPCVIHHPSEHWMRTWPLHWRDDRSLMERTCPHGVGHPDPDDAAFHVLRGLGAALIHGCDGCCRPPAV